MSRLVIIIHSNNETLDIGISERYNLTIEKNEEMGGNYEAILTADTCYGVIRGLESFYQLIQAVLKKNEKAAEYFLINQLEINKLKNEEEFEYVINNLPIKIEDFPKFMWRGLMIDTARHFVEKEQLLKDINAMTFAKMNVFHWHFTDHESYSITSKKYPQIQTGTFNPHSIYSLQDISDVIQFARDRGIIVIPEIDMPSHCASFSKAFPNLTVS